MTKRKNKVNCILLIVLVIIISFFIINKGMDYYYKSVYPIKYYEYVSKYSKKYSVDINLIYAVIHTESSFKADAKSNLNARGLMQIMDTTFEWAKCRMNEKNDKTTYDDLYDCENNIKYGTYILSLLTEEFDSESSAIAAYHAGRGNVNKWLNDPKKSSDGKKINDIPIVNTKEYVEKVNKTKQVYQSLYDF